METKSMLYLVSEYAPNGEIFGNNHLPILIWSHCHQPQNQGWAGMTFRVWEQEWEWLISIPRFNPFPHFRNRNQRISFPGMDGNGISRSPLFRFFALHILIFNSSLIILTPHTSMWMNRKICRVHRSPWPHVRRAGSKKVPSDGCCYRVLPCKVVDYSVIIIFLDLISSWYNLLTSAWMGVYCVRVWKRWLTLRMHIKTELRRYHTILCLCAWLIMKTEEKNKCLGKPSPGPVRRL